MRKAKPEIKFEKWKDPYGENIRDVEMPGFSLPRVKKEFGDGYEEDSPESDDEQLPNMPLRFMPTSMGAIPMTEYTQPSKVFNFWVGHTNFSITEEIYDLVEKVDGVEILDIFTRYRFRIGIGKLFSDGQVLRNINKDVFKYLKTNK